MGRNDWLTTLFVGSECGGLTHEVFLFYKRTTSKMLTFSHTQRVVVLRVRLVSCALTLIYQLFSFQFSFNSFAFRVLISIYFIYRFIRAFNFLLKYSIIGVPRGQILYIASFNYFVISRRLCCWKIKFRAAFMSLSERFAT